MQSTSARGLPIIGLYLNQAQTGYIYDLIHYVEAMKVENLSLTSFSYLIEAAGKVLAKKQKNKSNRRDAPTARAPS